MIYYIVRNKKTGKYVKRTKSLKETLDVTDYDLW